MKQRVVMTGTDGVLCGISTWGSFGQETFMTVCQSVYRHGCGCGFQDQRTFT